jgi:hypothetical protein
MANKQSFSIKDLKCEKVVVFTDRAEVKRSVKAKLNKGENEILLTNVSNMIDRDSVRVEGRGQATVVDVVCQSRHVVESSRVDNSDSKVKELKNEIKNLEEQVARTNQKLQRLTRQISVLNDFAHTLAKPVQGGSNNGLALDLTALNSALNVGNFMGFIDTYSTKLEQLDQTQLDTQNTLREQEDQLSVARENLQRIIGHETYNELM